MHGDSAGSASCGRRSGILALGRCSRGSERSSEIAYTDATCERVGNQPWAQTCYCWRASEAAVKTQQRESRDGKEHGPCGDPDRAGRVGLRAVAERAARRRCLAFLTAGRICRRLRRGCPTASPICPASGIRRRGFIRDLAKDPKEPVPFQPWAKAEYDVRASGAKWREEPDANCLPQGVPKILWAPAPWRIVQTPTDRLLRPRGVQSLVAGVHGRPPVQRQPRQRADVARLLDGEVGRRHARRRQPRLQRPGLARPARQAVHRERCT